MPDIIKIKPCGECSAAVFQSGSGQIKSFTPGFVK